MSPVELLCKLSSFLPNHTLDGLRDRLKTDLSLGVFAVETIHLSAKSKLVDVPVDGIQLKSRESDNESQPKFESQQDPLPLFRFLIGLSVFCFAP